MPSAALFLAGAGFALYACGDDDGTSPVTPAIAVSVGTPATVTFEQGAGGTKTVSVTRSGDFADVITFTLEDAPEGLTASFEPASVPAGTTTSTLTLAAGFEVEVGSYETTLRATGAGVTDATTVLTVVVTAATGPRYALSLAPAAVSLAPGGNGTVTATIARAGAFAGPVDLAVTGAPAGVTTAVTTSPVTDNTATIAVTVDGAAAPGNYPLTVTGTATGVASQTATLSVNVTGSANQNLTLDFCADDAPNWLAVQDGAGAWTRVTSIGANSYAFTFTSGRGGVAYVTRRSFESTSTAFLNVLYASAVELGASGAVSVPCTGGGKTVHGSVVGLATFDIAAISIGTAGAFVNPTESAFTLSGVPDGPHDLIAARGRRDVGSEETETILLNRIIIRHALDPADGSTLPVLDFGSAEAFAPAAADVTIAGLGTDDAIVGVSLVTADGSSPLFFADPEPGARATRPYYGLPDAQLAAGELHRLFASAQVNGAANSSRAAELFFRTVADRTVTLGPALDVPAISAVATAPYLRLRARFNAQAQYDRLARVSYWQSGGSVSVAMTSSYAAGAFDLIMPDFSTVTGWNNAWGLGPARESSPIGWTATGTGGALAFRLPGQLPTDGTAIQEATRNGSFEATPMTSARK